MLVVKTYINYNQIDELWIHNVTPERDLFEPIHTYRVEKPVGYENLIIKHKRSDGAWKLIKKVLNLIGEDL